MIQAPGGLEEGNGCLLSLRLLVGCDLQGTKAQSCHKWNEGKVVLSVADPESWQDCWSLWAPVVDGDTCSLVSVPLWEVVSLRLYSCCLFSPRGPALSPFFVFSPSRG